MRKILPNRDDLIPKGVESHPTLSQPPTDEGWRAGAGL